MAHASLGWSEQNCLGLTVRSTCTINKSKQAGQVRVLLVLATESACLAVGGNEPRP